MKPTKPTILDRAIAYVSPTRGARRLFARAQFQALENYNGASKKKRSLSEWNPGTGSANADVPDLTVLRERSHDLIRNVPIATGAVATITQRVIGTGLAFQPAPDFETLGISEDQAGEWAETVRARLERWAESTEADASRATNFYGVQGVAYRASKVGGDCFALLPMIEDARRLYQLAVLLIEAERVVNPPNQRDVERFAGGIESDSFGAPVAVHIAQVHPGALGTIGRNVKTDRVPVFGADSGRRNVLHVIDTLRPGQSRGVPYLAPIMETIKQLGRYTEAEIDAAVMSAFFAVFVKTAGGTGLSPMDSAMSPSVGSNNGGKPWDGRLGSGLVVNLEAGEEIQSAIANRPNPAFDDFVMSVFRQIAIGLSMPVEVLIKSFQSSFSASKAALLDLYIYVTTERARFAVQFCQPIAEALITEDVARGRIAAPGFLFDPQIRAAWCRGYWVGDGPGHLDPIKEAEAALIRVNGGLSTLERESMAIDGSNWRDNLRQRGREQAFIRDQGVEIAAPTTTNAPRPAQDSEDPNNDR